MKKYALALTLGAALAFSGIATAQDAAPSAPAAAATTIGPAKGYLIIVGGGAIGPEIFKKFVALAGGPKANIVFVPTAGGDEAAAQALKIAAAAHPIGPNDPAPVLVPSEDHTPQTFYDYGAAKVTVLHTNDPKVADTDAFIEPLKTATGVWFNGGRQWHIADSYLGTKTEKAFDAVLDRGGVIGGTSAGASIQGSYLVRGDTKGNEVVEGDHTVGLGFLRNSAIDQHFLTRNRPFDLIPLIQKHPELLGISLDERTAIVVHGNSFQVLGPSYVAITDAHQWSDQSAKSPNDAAQKGKIYFLRDGQKFDLVTRKVSGQGDYGPDQNIAGTSSPSKNTSASNDDK
jgi:cyanophycinase